MSESDPKTDVSTKEQFVFASNNPEKKEIKINLTHVPEGTEKIIVDLGNGSQSVIEIKAPTNESEKEIEASVEPKAFEPGFVFTEEMLPEDKKYLAGGICTPKNEDGKVPVFSKELLGSGGTHSDFIKIIQDLNKQYGCEFTTPTHNQWSALLEDEELSRLAKIEDEKAYLADDPGNPISGTVPVRWSFENDRDMYSHWKASCAKYGRVRNSDRNDLGGRAISIEEEFDLVDVAPE